MKVDSGDSQEHEVIDGLTHLCIAMISCDQPSRLGLFCSRTYQRLFVAQPSSSYRIHPPHQL